MRRFGVLVFALLCAVQTLLAANKQAETFNMQKAYEAFQNQDYQTAVDCLNKELADDAKNGYAYLWMAIAYTKVDDYGSMLTNSDKAIQYLPKRTRRAEEWLSTYGQAHIQVLGSKTWLSPTSPKP